MTAATYTCTQYINFAQPLSVSPTTSTTYRLDAARFKQHDLGLFIESLETIARIERERHERRQRRREQKLHEARIAELEDESRRSRSPTPTADEAIDEPVTYMEAKCIPYAISEAMPLRTKDVPDYYSCDDEAYGSIHNSPRSSVTYCSCSAGVSSIDSDSAESGIFAGTPPPTQLHPRPRSQVLSKPKPRTTRSRIISMVLKREYSKTPSAEALPQMHNETESRCRKPRRSRRPDTAEECFLDKALRYLTL